MGSSKITREIAYSDIDGTMQREWLRDLTRHSRYLLEIRHSRSERLRCLRPNCRDRECTRSAGRGDPHLVAYKRMTQVIDSQENFNAGSGFVAPCGRTSTSCALSVLSLQGQAYAIFARIRHHPMRESKVAYLLKRKVDRVHLGANQKRNARTGGCLDGRSG